MVFLGMHGAHPVDYVLIPAALGVVFSGFALLWRYKGRLSPDMGQGLQRAYHLVFAASCLMAVWAYVVISLYAEYLFLFYLGLLIWFAMLNCGFGLVLSWYVSWAGPEESDRPAMPSRRGFLAGSACLGVCSLGGAGGVGLAAGASAGPDLVLASYLRLERPVGPKVRGELRLSLISDTHAGFFLPRENLEQTLKHVADFSPDVVLFAGDLVECDLSALDEVGWFLEALAAQSPVYAVLGNHDCYVDPERVVSFHQAHGIRVLRGEMATLDGRWGQVNLAGFRGYTEPEYSMACLIGADMDNTVLLAHNPDQTLDLPRGYIPWLSLCGHTHGGQWRLPGLGPLVNQADRRFEPRLNRVEGRSVFVTPGLGYSGLPVRIFCSPEVSNLVLA